MRSSKHRQENKNIFFIYHSKKKGHGSISHMGLYESKLILTCSYYIPKSRNPYPLHMHTFFIYLN
ncbi:hypothetical protein RchiOBHm_Chr1g0343631 [Rosa chinensis]|uniref:Uncharacterized protein n=1 Tax=Rosa chinensis TaxID=74649 RepID=A0A2P6SEB6_ROSCH|nr:hypothetical protein RchiOBHm_Chr1g0343631 [Rosa chinensis]